MTKKKNNNKKKKEELRESMTQICLVGLYSPRDT